LLKKFKELYIMKLITLGNCCKKSKQNHENAVIAAKNCGLEPPVNVGDPIEIAKYGVMSLPALVLNGKVIAMGRLLSVEQIETLIKGKMAEEDAAKVCTCGCCCNNG
jgi:predicted thioredoxin/glutaredoxin